MYSDSRTPSATAQSQMFRCDPDSLPGGRSRTISIGLSMDILGSKIEIRDDGGGDHVEGTFETIDS
jgi:hypothetical protein